MRRPSSGRWRRSPVSHRPWVKIVTNAGGLNPAGLAMKLRELLHRLGLRASVAHIEGDDMSRGSANSRRPAMSSATSTQAARSRRPALSRSRRTPT